MRFASVCSGIEAASVAWKPLGWEAAFLAENAGFPSAVLRHHYPEVENRGDMSRYKEWPRERIDLLVGGTPCQSFSVAGLRKGLDDPRGNLALVFLGLVDRLRPSWVVWENVPGILSSSGGRDLGAFIGGLGQLGYGWAYRVLDAQHFGVPQRRRRIFLVGHSRGWRRPAAVLFEPEGLRGDPPPSDEAGKRIAEGSLSRALSRVGGGDDPGANKGAGLVVSGEVAPTVTGGPPYSRTGNERVEAEALVAFGGNDTRGPIDVATACRAKGGTGHGDFESETFIAYRKSKRAQTDEDDESWVEDDKANTINTFDGGDVRATTAIAFKPSHFTRGKDGAPSDKMPPLTKEADRGDQEAVVHQAGLGVRRLTPRECERLQGFPDDYTLVPYRGALAADGPRYKALGNSMAVPVMRWIGARIALLESIAPDRA